MSDAQSDDEPSLTERLLEEGNRRLHESRRLLEDLTRGRNEGDDT